MALYFLLVLRHRPAVLCRQLQLRRRRALLADDLSAARGAGRAGAAHGCWSARWPPVLAGRRAVGAVALLLFQLLCYAPVARATTEEAWAARADVRFAARRRLAVAAANPTCSRRIPACFTSGGSTPDRCSQVVDRPDVSSTVAGRRVPGRGLRALEFLVQRPGPGATGVLSQEAMARGRSSWSRNSGSGTRRLAFYRVRCLQRDRQSWRNMDRVAVQSVIKDAPCLTYTEPHSIIRAGSDLRFSPRGPMSVTFVSGTRHAFSHLESHPHLLLVARCTSRRRA